jgi:hypothetical protein
VDCVFFERELALMCCACKHAHADCFSKPPSVTNLIGVYLRLLSALFGGLGPLWNQNGVCSSAYLGLSVSSFLINVFAVGMLINKMTRPDPQLTIADTAIIKTRNGRPLFQTRFISGQGNKLTSIRVGIFVAHPMTSLEGEAFMRVSEAASEVWHRGGIIPLSVNHHIVDGSPLYGADLLSFRGYIEVVVEAYDSFLGCVVKDSMVYDASNIRIAYDYDDMVIVGPRAVLAADARGGDPRRRPMVELNARQLGAVHPLAPQWRQLCEGTLRKLAAASAAQAAVDASNIMRATQKIQQEVQLQEDEEQQQSLGFRVGNASTATQLVVATAVGLGSGGTAYGAT